MLVLNTLLAWYVLEELGMYLLFHPLAQKHIASGTETQTLKVYSYTLSVWVSVPEDKKHREGMSQIDVIKIYEMIFMFTSFRFVFENVYWCSLTHFCILFRKFKNNLYFC